MLAKLILAKLNIPRSPINFFFKSLNAINKLKEVNLPLLLKRKNKEAIEINKLKEKIILYKGDN
jgi:hypothetical protein